MDANFPAVVPERGGASERVFLGVSLLLFIVSVGGTVYWSASMSSAPAMSGDMGMSVSSSAPMIWTKLPDQTWLSAAAAFLAMWLTMMVAMMLPTLVPALLSFRRSVGRLDTARLGWLTVLAGVGYFCVWAIFGAVAYPLAVIVTAAEAQWMDAARWLPVATGVALLLAGGLQFTPWKVHQLVCCRVVPTWSQPPNARNAWQYGLSSGVHCALCCVGLMAILLGSGVMDLGIMTLIAAAITLERLAPRPAITARVLGILIVVAALFMIVRAASMG